MSATSLPLAHVSVTTQARNHQESTMDANTHYAPLGASTSAPLTQTRLPTGDIQVSEMATNSARGSSADRDSREDVGATGSNWLQEDAPSYQRLGVGQGVRPSLAALQSSVYAGAPQGPALLIGGAHGIPARPQPLSSYHGTSLASRPPSWEPTRSQTLPIRPAREPTLFARRYVLELPSPGKIYYIPDGRHIPNSLIHKQKRQAGFFEHPALVVGTDRDIAYFYALTKAPPHAIGQLNMCLRIGTTTVDEGLGVLKLAAGSPPMLTETWVNLEQRFTIEWKNLDNWATDVRVDLDDTWKIWKRVQELEADQNRYLYKPLPRDMSVIQPGTVVMLPNNARSATLGAPVLVLENDFPRFYFLRIKTMSENMHFNPAAKRRNGNPRRLCLEISDRPKIGHDGTPVMLLEAGSPSMREQSYVEVRPRAKPDLLERAKSWCWPPVMLRPHSIQLLREFMRRAAARPAEEELEEEE
ncbi:hypothetical protein N0V83_008867 [Neocucurbitaria cava]|uniref:Uncharacterized protein n=1 Tax=Neocucurbitaria cava TaxID=798079 RepID=A0A9W8Y2U9_9PLEO|nr:hypothetical protein N0V83_008867 [Neocucurbitaria cava]